MKGTCAMRFFLNGIVSVMALLAACIAAMAAQSIYDVGRTPTQEEIRAWDISIGPEGKGLPPGSGTAQEGAKIFAQKCAVCHGQNGEGGSSGVAGRVAPPLIKPTTPKPDGLGSWLTLGSWPFATTIWDFTNRAMPLNQGRSLKADEVYALTAFLLYRNGVIQESTVLDAKSLPKIQMPNRNAVVPPWPKWDQIRHAGPIGVYP